MLNAGQIQHLMERLIHRLVKPNQIQIILVKRAADLRSKQIGLTMRKSIKFLATSIAILLVSVVLHLAISETKTFTIPEDDTALELSSEQFELLIKNTDDEESKDNTVI